MEPIKEALTFDDVLLLPKYSSIVPSQTNLNIKLSNFILGTAIGIFPSVFIWATIGLGFDRLVIRENEFPNYMMILTAPETKIPLLGFLIFFITLLAIRMFVNYKYKK